MKEFKGSKGPWEHEDGDIWSGDELVTTISDEFQPQDTHQKNANLIAAAPDLLKELQRAAEIYDALLSDGYLGYKDDSIRASTVIAKALGEPK